MTKPPLCKRCGAEKHMRPGGRHWVCGCRFWTHAIRKRVKQAPIDELLLDLAAEPT